MLQNVDSLIPFLQPRKTEIVPSVVRLIAMIAIYFTNVTRGDSSMIAIYFCRNGGHIRESASIVIYPCHEAERRPWNCKQFRHVSSGNHNLFPYFFRGALAILIYFNKLMALINYKILLTIFQFALFWYTFRVLQSTQWEIGIGVRIDKIRNHPSLA